MSWESLLIVGAVLLIIGYIVYRKVGEHVIHLISYGMLIVGGVLVVLGLIYLVLAFI